MDRRAFLAGTAAAAALPAAIARAASIDAAVRTGTIRDVEHVVILMQENRSFDHYFGAMAGVRGFGDPFPIPLPDHPDAKGRTVWAQANRTAPGHPPIIAPFALNTAQTFAHMRIEGTPHNWIDAQLAWDDGRMAAWPAAKGEHAMGGYRAEDIPFQHALAGAFTICDAYHCSFQGGTNTNRLFLWSGTNDPGGTGGGPSINNSHDRLAEQGGAADGYRWTTYLERLQAAGVSWRIYQDMADNFTDNPAAGFQAFRDSLHGAAGSDPRLAAEGLSTFKLDRLKADVAAGRLPQVSHVVAPAAASEHPDPSSPAQGADFTASVIDALTSNPKVWAKTVLLVMFDENDGFFDHVPPPAPPGRDATGALAGGSTVDTAGEYHLIETPADKWWNRPDLMGRAYGLGPRVPMYVVSPWSRGGWVSSEVFDHTSVIRFLETRFGVTEPNISAWRRAVCGDLTRCFDFRTPNAHAFARSLPATAETASRAAALPKKVRPPTPATPEAPVQAAGTRPSRALPYAPEAALRVQGDRAEIKFRNDGASAVVLHAYDRRRLALGPRRYTVGPGKALDGTWALDDGAYDLWILGPNGFHRGFRGTAADGLDVGLAVRDGRLVLSLASETGGRGLIVQNAYAKGSWKPVAGPTPVERAWPLKASGGWYDLIVTDPARPGLLRRLAGRAETGRDSISDPLMGGPARMTWS